MVFGCKQTAAILTYFRPFASVFSNSFPYKEMKRLMTSPNMSEGMTKVSLRLILWIGVLTKHSTCQIDTTMVRLTFECIDRGWEKGFFMINAPVICIHGPTYGDSRGIAELRCRAITFWLSLQCQGIARVLTLGPLPRWDFLFCRMGLRAGL